VGIKREKEKIMYKRQEGKNRTVTKGGKKDLKFWGGKRYSNQGIFTWPKRTKAYYPADRTRRQCEEFGTFPKHFMAFVGVGIKCKRPEKETHC